MVASFSEWRITVIYKRGRTYWYDVTYDGIRYQKSTRVRNLRDAEAIESAFKTNLARAMVGIEKKQERHTPTLAEFKPVFMQWVRSKRKNLNTQNFYENCFNRLIAYKPLSSLRLNEIDEPVIESFKLAALEKTGQSSVNRYLATLRKALRYAWRNLRLINRLPVIELYEGERQRTLVFSDEHYKLWLATALEPLRSASVLAHDCGICRGEILALQKDCVHLLDAADENGLWGTIEIRRGLKREARRRTVPITEPMAEVLSRLLAESECDHVFTSPRDHRQKLSGNTIANQHRIIMKSCNFAPDSGLHTLRHTFLTEAGRYAANVRALQLLAGHSDIKTTMRYVHPDQKDVTAIAGQVAAARAKRSGPQVTTTIFTTAEVDEAVVSSKVQ
jgi:integrase